MNDEIALAEERTGDLDDRSAARSRTKNARQKRRSASPQIRPSRRPPTRPPVRGWGAGWVDLLNSTLEQFKSLYWSARTSPRLRSTIKQDLRSTLSTLLPLITLRWNLHLLTLTVPPSCEDPERRLRGALNNMARRAAFSGCTGFVFRHLGRKRGRYHLHLVLASPPELKVSHNEWKKILRGKLTKGFSGVTSVYLNTDGDKRFWPCLSTDEKRQGLEALLLYLTREYLGKRGKRKAPWSKRVTQFNKKLAPTGSSLEPAPFPLLTCQLRNTWIFKDNSSRTP